MTQAEPACTVSTTRSVNRRPADFVPIAGAPGDIYPRFAEVAAARPTATAVLGTKPISYRQLDDAAVAVAHSVAGAHRVALLTEHGMATMCGQLGVLAAGASYLPLEPRWPTRRISELIALVRPSAVLCSPALRERAEIAVGASSTTAVVTMPTPTPTPDDAAPPVAAPRERTAYVLCTSGSTGVPKAVAQTNDAVLHTVANHVNMLHIAPSDVVTVLSSFAFDMAVTDTYAALLAGARVLPIDIATTGLMAAASEVAAQAATVVHLTPTVFRYLMDAAPDARIDLTSVRVVVLGGEPLTWSDVRLARRRFAPDCVVVNGYGATEASFAVQHHLGPGDPIGGPDTAVVPIGRALPGFRIELDPVEDQRPLPPGEESGEIVIHSAHVALGYLGDEVATRAKFVSTGAAERGYRTGDLARRDADGVHHGLGRTDRQIKVRGFRVEPAEVEAAIRALPGIARCCVVPGQGARGETELIAHIEPAGAKVQVNRLHQQIRRILPAHLVPGRWLLHAKLPLTSTGKIDRQALKDCPDPGAVPARWPGADHRATGSESIGRTTVEVTTALSTAFAAELGRAIAPDTPFVEAGAHSLTLAAVQARLRTTFPSLTLVDLFRYPTITALAERLSSPDPEPDTAGAERMARRAAQRSGRRRPR